MYHNFKVLGQKFQSDESEGIIGYLNRLQAMTLLETGCEIN